MKKKDRIKELEARVAELLALCKSQSEEISYLRGRVSELEARLSQNSSNSSKPPSSDLYRPKQTRSLRVKGINKPGSQPGHKGDTLRFSDCPDAVEEHSPGVCCGCGHDLSGVMPSGYGRRQVYDLPEIRIRVTEHRSQTKRCPGCGESTKASFPAGVAQPAQYGPAIKALGTYLTQYQLLPYERTAELFEDLFSHRISVSFLSGNNGGCAAALAPFVAALKDVLSSCGVVHADETGLRIAGHRRWLHSLSTGMHSFYMPHGKRGMAAMEAMGILPGYRGTVVHDFWKPYFRFDCRHALCGSHLLRELKHCGEELGSHWAVWTAGLLSGLHARVEELKGQGLAHMRPGELDGWLCYYEGVMEMGALLHPPPDKDRTKRGRARKTKARNLLERFIRYRDDILRFASDFNVPFTNNNAEQAVRMMKVKQKISGCFRSEQGAMDFATIRSYIATMKKQGQNVMQALSAAFNNQPFPAMA